MKLKVELFYNPPFFCCCVRNLGVWSAQLQQQQLQQQQQQQQQQRIRGEVVMGKPRLLYYKLYKAYTSK